MLHLHGSVHFDMPDPHPDGELHEIVWQPDLCATFEPDAFGRSTDFNLEGVDFPTSVIVAGYGKTIQISKRPFRTYYSELDRLVADCDGLLIVGCGFGDHHLQEAFKTFRDPRRRPVVVIERRPSLRFVETDLIFQALRSIFRTNEGFMLFTGPDKRDHLDKVGGFETSANPKTPLAVWYDGILSACDNPDAVIGQLDKS